MSCYIISASGAFSNADAKINKIVVITKIYAINFRFFI